MDTSRSPAISGDTRVLHIQRTQQHQFIAHKKLLPKVLGGHGPRGPLATPWPPGYATGLYDIFTSEVATTVPHGSIYLSFTINVPPSCILVSLWQIHARVNYSTPLIMRMYKYIIWYDFAVFKAGEDIVSYCQRHSCVGTIVSALLHWYCISVGIYMRTVCSQLRLISLLLYELQMSPHRYVIF